MTLSSHSEKVKSVYGRDNNKNEDAYGGSMHVVYLIYQERLRNKINALGQSRTNGLIFHASMFNSVIACDRLASLLLVCSAILHVLFSISLTVFLLTFSGYIQKYYTITAY